MILKNLPFGQKFKICRLAANLSQEGAGMELGVSRVTISRWETSTQKPHNYICQRISEVFPEIGRLV